MGREKKVGDGEIRVKNVEDGEEVKVGEGGEKIRLLDCRLACKHLFTDAGV